LNAAAEARTPPALEAPLADVEARLAALGQALQAQDAGGVETEAAALHAALAAAVEHFARAARSGGVPPSMRQRLALAGGRVAAQREALARATAALDRAIDVLLPPPAGPSALYSLRGLRGDQRPASTGAIVA
jgi:hypothetical protein